MMIKYKVSDVAKDFGVPSKEIIALLAQHIKEPKKTASALNEEELSVIFEVLTQQHQSENFDAYFEMGARAREAAAAARQAEKEQKLAEQHKGVLMPGYTHLQIAMPSSFGLWFGAFAEGLVDDLAMMEAAYRVCNKNPLGSAAGYGSSFPLNREMTTDLLGFDTLSYNVVYAQMGRGKTERVLAQAMSSIAATLNKLATDNCLFLSQNFSFIAYPPELTTGSSIMPHKKNPDVWELMRSKCNRLMALPNEIAMMTTNLPTGYFRDLQLLKEVLFPAIQTLKECVGMADYMLRHITVKTDILDDPKYDYLFSVEVVNKLVLSGVPFREAYRQVGLEIENGTYKPSREVHHTHAGSIGNLCLDRVDALMTAACSQGTAVEQ